MNAVPRRGAFAGPRPASSSAKLTISIRLAVSALVLTAILLTAAACSLLWWRTAESISRELASTIDEQIVAAVRKEVLAIVDEARAAHTAVRTLFLQNVLDAREADKREFVFLSQLQSQPTISWVAFGWPGAATERRCDRFVSAVGGGRLHRGRDPPASASSTRTGGRSAMVH